MFSSKAERQARKLESKQKSQDARDLFNASWSVVKTNKRLLWLPTMAAAATLAEWGVIMAVYHVFHLGDFIFGDTRHTAYGYFLNALVTSMLFFTTANFFNAAFIASVLAKLHGEDGGIKYGLGVARSRIKAILAYSLFAATVGAIIRTIETYVPFLAVKILTFFLGLGWSVANIFAIPVIVVTGKSPIEAVKESSRTIKERWGLVVRGEFVQYGLKSLLFMLPGIAVMLGAVYGGIFAVVTSNNNHPNIHSLGDFFAVPGIYLPIAIFVLSIVYMMLVTLFFNAIASVFQVALYEYARTGEAPARFEERMFKRAFKPKKKLFV